MLKKKLNDLIKGTVQTSSPRTLANGLKEEMIEEFSKLEYDSKVVANMIEKYPDLIDELASYTTADGKPLFSALEIDDILYNCKGTIQKDPQLLITELNKPGAIEDIATWSNRSKALLKKVSYYKD